MMIVMMVLTFTVMGMIIIPLLVLLLPVLSMVT